MSELDDRLADSARVTAYLRSLQGGTAPPVVEPPIVIPPEPPVVPPVTGNMSFQGDLRFDGSRFDTSGIVGPVIAVFRITIPNPLPDGWSGRSSQVSVFENGNGTYWMHAALSKTAGDMSPSPPAAAGSTGPNIWMSFNAGSPSAVPVVAGEVWYLNVVHTFWTVINPSDNKPSVGPDQPCDFGVKLYPPS